MTKPDPTLLVEVYMKLKSPRRKDQVDVIEMIKGGIDTTQCRTYLVAHAPALVPVFDECIAQAEAEQGLIREMAPSFNL